MAQQVTTDENTYRAVPRLTKEAAIITDDEEQRNVIVTDQFKRSTSFLSRIGQLRMNFKVNNKTISFNGTASVFSVDKNKNKVYAVTCAHNFKYFEPIHNETVSCIEAWFERRNTIDRKNSKSIQEYKIIDQWVHPDYDPSKAVSQHDLAIITFENKDEYFSNLQEEMSSLDNENPELVHIYGYPISYRGALCGQSKKATITQDEKTNLLQYDIQTTPGQSGSPIIKVTKQRQIVPAVYGFAIIAILYLMYLGSTFDFSFVAVVTTFFMIILIEFGINCEIFPREKKEVSIIGIHTTGSGTGNIGVKLTKTIISKIREQDFVKDIQKDYVHGADSFYCLRDTPL